MLAILNDPTFYPVQGLEQAAIDFAWMTQSLPPAMIEQWHAEALEQAKYDDRIEVYNWDESSAYAVMIDRSKAIQLVQCEKGIHDWEYYDEGDCESGPMPSRACKCCGVLE